MTPHTVETPCITFDSPWNLTSYSHPSVTVGDWFQDPTQDQNAQVPYKSSQSSTFAFCYVYNTLKTWLLICRFADAFFWLIPVSCHMALIEIAKQLLSTRNAFVKFRLGEPGGFEKKILKRKNKVGWGSSCKFYWVSLNIIFFVPLDGFDKIKKILGSPENLWNHLCR